MNRASSQTGTHLRWLLIVLLLALVLRIWYLISYSQLPDWEQLTVDNYYHHHWAQDIATGNILGDTTYFRAPLYVWCLGLLYALFGSSLWVARIFGLVIGLTSVGLTYAIGSRAFNTRVGAVAALIQAVYPLSVYFEGELLLDPLYTLLLQLVMLGFLRWWETRSVRTCFVTGLLLGLAAIARPTALVFMPVLLVLIVMVPGLSGRRLRYGLLIMLGIAVPILPITIRNLAVAGDAVLISSQGGINLYIGNNDAADGVSAVLPEPLGHNWQIRQITHMAEEARGRDLTPGAVSRFWAKRAVRWMATHPGKFVNLYGKKIYHSLSNRRLSNNRNLDHFFKKIPLLKYNPLSFALLLALSVIAAAAGYRSERKVLVLAVPIIVYTLGISLFFVNTRFRLPLIPFHAILSAVGVFILAEVIRYRHRKLLIAVLIGAAAGLASGLPLVSLPYGVTSQPATMQGLYYMAQGDFRQALGYHRLALAADPEFPEVNLNMGVCFLRLGQEDSARYYLEREQQMHPGRPKAYTNLASLHLINGRYRDAVLQASRAISIAPYDVTANTILVRAVASIPSVSADSLLSVIAEARGRVEDDLYFLNDVSARLVELGRYEPAEELLSRALNTQPPPIETDDEAFGPSFRNSTDNWRRQIALAHFQAGYLFGLQRRYQEAVRHSQLAIAGDSDLVRAYVNLTSGLWSLGQTEQAVRTLETALERFPDDSLVQRLRRSLPLD